MEIDLTEYDQVDEILLMMESHNGQLYPADSPASRLLVTLSSCSSDPAGGNEEANSENDFVFLPEPAPTQKNDPASHQQAATKTVLAQERPKPELKPSLLPTPYKIGGEPLATATVPVPASVAARTLAAISSNSIGNPFGNCPPRAPEAIAGLRQQQQQSSLVVMRQSPAVVDAACASKPVGPIEPFCATVPSNPSKLAELMQQIVTRSDLIYIAIPCSLCHEPIACPPSDLSSWLNHMSRQHNCKLCPVCNKLVGLGPKREVDVMRHHVLEHLDADWLERGAAKVSFTFGLQQQWFSSNRCIVKDQRYK